MPTIVTIIINKYDLSLMINTFHVARPCLNPHWSDLRIHGYTHCAIAFTDGGLMVPIWSFPKLGLPQNHPKWLIDNGKTSGLGYSCSRKPQFGNAVKNGVFLWCFNGGDDAKPWNWRGMFRNKKMPNLVTHSWKKNMWKTSSFTARWPH